MVLVVAVEEGRRDRVWVRTGAQAPVGLHVAAGGLGGLRLLCWFAMP